MSLISDARLQMSLVSWLENIVYEVGKDLGGKEECVGVPAACVTDPGSFHTALTLVELTLVTWINDPCPRIS